DVGATGNEDCIEKGGPLAVILVIWDNSISNILIFMLCKDRLAFGADDDWECTCCVDRCFHSRECNGIVAIPDQYRDTSGCYLGCFRVQLGLAYPNCLLSSIGSSFLLRYRTSDLCRHILG